MAERGGGDSEIARRPRKVSGRYVYSSVTSSTTMSLSLRCCASIELRSSSSTFYMEAIHVDVDPTGTRAATPSSSTYSPFYEDRFSILTGQWERQVYVTQRTGIVRPCIFRPGCSLASPREKILANSFFSTSIRSFTHLTIYLKGFIDLSLQELSLSINLSIVTRSDRSTFPDLIFTTDSQKLANYISHPV